MAEHVFTNAHVTLNSVDLSDHVRQARLRYSAEPQDITAMSDLTRTRLGGLKDWSLEIEFNQDYAASEIDATLFAIVGSVFAISLRPDAGAQSSTNPTYSGSALLADYQPMGGGVGEAHVSPITLQAAGTLTRTAT